MFTSLAEFKFFQTFRIPVESKDDVRFLFEYEDTAGKFQYIDDAVLRDISITGIGVKTKARISIEQNLRMSFHFKKLRFDLSGHIVRSIGSINDEEEMFYGIEIDPEDQAQMRRLIDQFIMSFSPERAKSCLVDLALSDRYKNISEGFEVFSLMLSLYKDIIAFGNNENFIESLLEEMVRILNAQRASIFLINPDTNELEAVHALGINKDILKFDYRKGIAGAVFTTGIPLNINTELDEVRFSHDVDSVTGFQTKSILCFPISNKEDKVIGVIEVLNKRSEDRFTEDDEKVLKILSMIFSSTFYNYNPMSERSLIRRFSAPYDREFAYIGKSKNTNELRKTIVKLKDIDSEVLIEGEVGTGKKLLSHIIHNEGKRGLSEFKILSCKGVPETEFKKIFFGEEDSISSLEEAHTGTYCFEEISFLPLYYQMELLRFLKERKIYHSEKIVDVRMIFTSSVNLSELVALGKFNKELFEMISTTVVRVEPLRQRPEDITDLIEHFLKKECHKQGLLIKSFSEEIMDKLLDYDWPDNVVGIKKAVEKAVLYNPKSHIISKLDKGALSIIDFSRQKIKALDSIPYARDYNIPLKDRVALVEREMILSEIKRHAGNKTKAAKSMGISREALRKKMLISDEVLDELSKDKEIASRKKVA